MWRQTYEGNLHNEILKNSKVSANHLYSYLFMWITGLSGSSVYVWLRYRLACSGSSPFAAMVQIYTRYITWSLNGLESGHFMNMYVFVRTWLQAAVGSRRTLTVYLPSSDLWLFLLPYKNQRVCFAQRRPWCVCEEGKTGLFMKVNTGTFPVSICQIRSD